MIEVQSRHINEERMYDIITKSYDKMLKRKSIISSPVFLGCAGNKVDMDILSC